MLHPHIRTTILNTSAYYYQSIHNICRLLYNHLMHCDPEAMPRGWLPWLEIRTTIHSMNPLTWLPHMAKAKRAAQREEGREQGGQ